jgi:hypothetical protein
MLTLPLSLIAQVSALKERLSTMEAKAEDLVLKQDALVPRTEIVAARADNRCGSRAKPRRRALKTCDHGPKCIGPSFTLVLIRCMCIHIASSRKQRSGLSGLAQARRSWSVHSRMENVCAGYCRRRWRHWSEI